MSGSRWQVAAAFLAVALAIAWGLWPRNKASTPAAPELPAAASPGVVGHALRDAVAQSGAPGSTPPVQRPPGDAEGYIEVRVLAQRQVRAGAHVRVYVHKDDWRLAGAGDTGADGTVRVAAGPGTYLVAARFGTFAPARAEVQRPAGERTTKVAVELQPGVFISGRTVQKGTQEPVPLAQVTLTWARNDAPAEEQARATSDALGRFRVEGLQPGPYRAVAQAPGYAKGTLRIDAAASKDVVLELAQASFIEGHVYSADGSPAAGADVFASGGPETITTVTTATGGFSMEAAPRTWSVSARRGEEAGRVEAPVTVAAGMTARGVDIRLGAGSTLQGTVIAARTQKGIPGATVAASPHGADGDFGRATTDASGAFSLKGLAAGGYDLDVAADGFTATSVSGVTVGAGQRFPLRIELRETGAVEGVVRDASGRAVPYALVRTAAQRFWESRRPASEARADESGAYRLAGIPSGRGLFMALREGSPLGTTAPADVPEGGTARLDFELKDEGVVTGRVRRGDGSLPPAEASVRAFPTAGRRRGGAEFATIPIDATGTYLASLPAGTWNLNAAGPRAGGALRTSAFVTIEAGKTVVQDLGYPDATDDAASGFSGIVLEPGGTPSPLALVRAVSTGAGHGIAFFERTDESGRFRIARARTDLPDTFDVMAENGGRTGRAPVAVQQTEVTVQLQPGGTVRGRLTSGPVDRFRVEVSGMGHDALLFSGDRFEVRDLPAGSMTVTVTAADDRSAEREVKLAPGGVAEIELALQPLAVVTGRAVDAVTQQPVADAFVNAEGTRATTGADGRFRVSVASGKRSVSVFSEHYRGTSKEFTAEAGASIELGDLVLQREAAAPGTIGVRLRGDSDTAPTIVYIVAEGPAQQAGLRVGDQILRVDGQPATSVPEATRLIAGAPGTPVRLAIQRGGTVIDVAVTRAR